MTWYCFFFFSLENYCNYIDVSLSPASHKRKREKEKSVFHSKSQTMNKINPIALLGSGFYVVKFTYHPHMNLDRCCMLLHHVTAFRCVPHWVQLLELTQTNNQTQ
jgi:hypothetical protein